MFLFGALCFRLALMCLFGLGCLIVWVDLIVVGLAFAGVRFVA